MGKEEKKEGRELTPWRPFRELSRLQREMDRLFEDFFRPSWGWGPRWWPERLWRWPLAERDLGAPALDVYEDKDAVVVKAELPGMTKKDIDVSISGDVLTLRGEKKKEEEVSEEDYYYCERSYGSFSRSVRLPAEVQADKAKASFKNGVLEIRLPKTEAAKRREITVKVE